MAKAPLPNQAADQSPESDPKTAETVKVPAIDLKPSDPRVRKVSITKWSKSKREDY